MILHYFHQTRCIFQVKGDIKSVMRKTLRNMSNLKCMCEYYIVNKICVY